MNIKDLEVGSWSNPLATETIDSIKDKDQTMQLRQTQFPMKNISPNHSPSHGKAK